MPTLEKVHNIYEIIKRNLCEVDMEWLKVEGRHSVIVDFKLDLIYLLSFLGTMCGSPDEFPLYIAEMMFCKDPPANYAIGFIKAAENMKIDPLLYEYKVTPEMTKHFDEFILDDFFFTNCKCEHCIEAKGDMEWDEFRVKLMTEAGQNLVINPAKKVNPKNVIQLAGGLWPHNYRIDPLNAGVGQWIDVLPVHYSTYEGIVEAKTDLKVRDLAKKVRVADNETASGLSTWQMKPDMTLAKSVGQCKHVMTRWPDELCAGAAFITYFGNFEFNWFMVIAVIALVCAYVMLYKTRFGLRLMACGEHPQAADSVGINVYNMRWAGVLISGALGGLGGICYILAGVSEWKFENGVAGFGFLALAVMIFGQWKPTRIALAALLFGLFRALSNVYVGIPFMYALNIPSGIYNMMPYIVSLVVLAFTSGHSRAPKAEGIPYDKGQR